jgi:hypothetical protein
MRGRHSLVLTPMMKTMTEQVREAMPRRTPCADMVVSCDRQSASATARALCTSASSLISSGESPESASASRWEISPILVAMPVLTTTTCDVFGRGSQCVSVRRDELTDLAASRFRTARQPVPPYLGAALLHVTAHEHHVALGQLVLLSGCGERSGGGHVVSTERAHVVLLLLLRGVLDFRLLALDRGV